MSYHEKDSEDELGSDPALHDEELLKVEIAKLAARVVSFEHKLETAVQSENEFLNNIRTLTGSLDSFVVRHLEDDHNLTRLIEEDTQRSREVKEEYDALASRFDDDVRPPSPTRVREFARTVSVYVGIVLSVVFMAPLSAVWWLLATLLAKMGYQRSTDVTPVYSSANRSRRSRASSAPVSGLPRNLRMSRKKRGTSASNAHTVQTEFLEGETETLGEAKILKDGTSNLISGAKAAASPQEETDNASKMAYDTDIGETDSSKDSEDEKNAPQTEACSSKGSSEDDEVFVDAFGSAASIGNEKVKNPASQNQDGEKRASEPSRPGWALLSGSSETNADLATFPSSEFWDISDDEIKLDFKNSKLNSLDGITRSRAHSR